MKFVTTVLYVVAAIPLDRSILTNLNNIEICLSINYCPLCVTSYALKHGLPLYVTRFYPYNFCTVYGTEVLGWRMYCIPGWSLFGKFGKLFENRVKFVHFRWKTIYAKYLRKISVYKLHMSSEISWVIPSQLNQCFHRHHLRFCSKLHQMCPCGSNEKSPSFRSKFQEV